MKQRAFAALMIAGLSLTAAPVFGQARDRNDDRDNRGPDRVCFYRDVEYQGPSWCYRPGDEIADLGNRKDEISSIRVFGRARVVVYDDEEFRGVSDEFDTDVPDLRLRVMAGRRDWNDRIESLQIVSFNRRGRGFFGRDDRFSRDRVCVYEDVDYRGRSQCWNADEEVRNLSGTGWNDRISSIRVFGRARIEVYRDADFRGRSLRIDRDVADLGRLNWGDQISSFQIR